MLEGWWELSVQAKRRLVTLRRRFVGSVLELSDAST